MKNTINSFTLLVLCAVGFILFSINKNLNKIVSSVEIQAEQAVQSDGYDYTYDYEPGYVTYESPSLKDQIIETEAYITRHEERQPHDAGWAFEKASAELSLAKLKEEVAYEKFAAEKRIELSELETE